MDRPALFGVDGTSVVDRVAKQVEDATQRGIADRNRYRRACIMHVCAADQAVSAAQSDTPHAIPAQMLLDLARKIDLYALLVRLNFYGVINRREVVFFELGIKRRTDHLGDFSNVLFGHRGCCHHNRSLSIGW